MDAVPSRGSFADVQTDRHARVEFQDLSSVGTASRATLRESISNQLSLLMVGATQREGSTRWVPGRLSRSSVAPRSAIVAHHDSQNRRKPGLTDRWVAGRHALENLDRLALDPQGHELAHR